MSCINFVRQFGLCPRVVRLDCSLNSLDFVHEDYELLFDSLLAIWGQSPMDNPSLVEGVQI